MRNSFPVATAQQLTVYVRALRKSQGYTQADVAGMLGVSKMRVATIEKDVGRLSSASLIRLLHLLGARLEVHTGDGRVAADTGERRESDTGTHPSPTPHRKGEW